MSTSETRNRIVTITDDVTALGMKLAGIGEVSYVKDGESATDLIMNYVNENTVAVIIITEELAEANRNLLNKVTQRPWPVIVEIPGPGGKIERESSTLKDLVKRALGIEMEI